MNKFRIPTSFLIILFFLFPRASKALAVTKTSGNLQVSFDEPIFSSSDAWRPGFSLSRELVVKNKGGGKETVIITSQNEEEEGDVASVLSFKVSESGVALYGGSGNSKTLADFWTDGEVDLGSILAGQTKTYRLTIEMGEQVGNSYQGKKAVFDLLVGFLGSSQAVSFSGVGGVSVQPFVCSATAPNQIPTLSVTEIGENSVSLSWTSVSPATHYLVAYGVSSGSYLFGNPNIGKATSFTVQGLSGGTTYFFVVRAINDCAPGAYSNEVSATPPGPVLAGPALGFVAGVLGVEEAQEKPAGEASTSEGRVEGVQKAKLSFWVGLSALTALGVAGIYFWLKMKSR